VDSTEDIGAAVANSVEKALQDISADGHITISAESETNTLLKVDDSLENPVSAIDDGEIAAVNQISQVSEPNTETSWIAAEEQNSKIEAENIGQDEIYKEFYSLLKKFEFSLQYRYDFTDVLGDNLEKENFQNSSKSIEKNRNKQRGRHQEDIERRFQEKQAENLRECLKQKRFANHLQK
jgi:hypothetical protein